MKRGGRGGLIHCQLAYSITKCRVRETVCDKREQLNTERSSLSHCCEQACVPAVHVALTGSTPLDGSTENPSAMAGIDHTTGT